MKIFFLKSLAATFLFILFSCSESKDENTVDLEQIRPKSANTDNNQPIVQTDSSEILLKKYKIDSIDLKLIKVQDIKGSNFLNRFPNINSGLRTLIQKDTSIQFQHEFYEYRDSNQMKNAFFNWLDCNGKDCMSIKLFEEIKIEKQNLLVITTSGSIDIIRSSNNLNPEDWINYVRFSRKIKDFKYIIFQKKNQKAKWFEFKTSKLAPKSKK
jgi:hypothetical protein